jgi:hypothetical protein
VAAAPHGHRQTGVARECGGGGDIGGIGEFSRWLSA